MDERALSAGLSVEAWRRIESACTRFENAAQDWDDQSWDDPFVTDLLSEFEDRERHQLLLQCEFEVNMKLLFQL